MKKMMTLAISLIASILFVPNVFAEENVAKIGNVGYQTLQAAVNAAGNNDVISLQANTNEDIVIDASKNITIDLGNYTLTNVSNHTITNSGTLKIIGNGTVDNITHGKATLYNNVSGNVIIKGGTFERSKEAGVDAKNNGGNSYYTILNAGTMTVEKATVKNKGAFSSLFENGWQDGNENTTKTEAKLTLKSGTYDGGLNTIKNDDYGVITIDGGKYQNYVQAAVLNWNKAEINDGTFKSESRTILNGYINSTMDQGILVINGGTFTSGNSKSIIEEISSSKNGGKIQITGGNFNVAANNLISLKNENSTDITITGGTYSIAPDESDLPEGYKVFENEDGTYEIAKAITLTIIANDISESIEIPAGSFLTTEEVAELKQLVIDELGDSKLKFEGFYNDENFRNEFDFTKPMNQDVTVYIKLIENKVEEKNESISNPVSKKDTTTEEVKNPNTSDINIPFLIMTILISLIGLGFTIKKQFN